MRSSRLMTVAVGLVAIVSGGLTLVSNASAEQAAPDDALTEVRPIGSARDAAYESDWYWATPDEVFYYRDRDDNLAVVNYVADGPGLVVDTYDRATFARVGQPRTISLDGWPRWGGFYAAPDGSFFVLVGRNNLDQEDAKDVVAVRHYSAAWELTGTAFVKGGASQLVEGISEPFDAGAPAMLMVDDRLVVHMSRLMYEDPEDGLRHQANLTFEVDVDTMVATTFEEHLEWSGFAYSSHSFQQLLTTYGDSLVMLDHGDAFPRAIQIGVMADYPTQREVETHEVLPFNAAPGDKYNFTGAGVTGLVSGPDGVVAIGRSIRHPDAPDGPVVDESDARNAFLLAFDPATGASDQVWLTDFAADGSTTALEPRVVQVAANRWVVLFSVKSGSTYRTEYRLIDSSAAVLASATIEGFYFSPISDPIELDGCVYWVGVEPGSDSVPNPAHLFGIDVTQPTSPTLGGSACSSGPTNPDPEPPVNTDPPRLKGKRTVGSVLRVDDGSWTPTPESFSYQWFRDDRMLRRESGATYQVRRKDRGHVVKVEVTASIEGAGSASAWTNGKRIR